MKNIFNFEDFILEEIEAEYKFTKSEKADREHNKLARKKEDGHEWKKKVKKSGESSMLQTYTCPCGYKKVVDKDEDKKVTITYSKGK